MNANRDAPVFSAGRIDVDAPAGRVWDVLADLDGWSRWNPDVKSMDVQGPLAEGTVFRWKAGPGTIVSTLSKVDRPRELAWTGRTMGIRAVHVWRFEDNGTGSVASMEESFEGLPARLMRRSLQRKLDATTTSGLAALKRAAEGRAGAPSSTP